LIVLRADRKRLVSGDDGIESVDEYLPALRTRIADEQPRVIPPGAEELCCAGGNPAQPVGFEPLVE